MRGATEELRFPEHEFSGTPWTNAPTYEKLFTALQRQRVPSKLVLFPDEGQCVLKPQNSRFWYSEVLGWLEQYLH